MGFFDEFDDTSGASFIKKEEKAVLLANATPLPVVSVKYQATSKYGPRYLLAVELEGEERTLSFNAESVESRDRMLDALKDYMSREDAEPVTVYIEQVGQSILVRNADTSE